jgi:hypothetical protein
MADPFGQRYQHDTIYEVWFEITGPEPQIRYNQREYACWTGRRFQFIFSDGYINPEMITRARPCKIVPA